MEVIKGSIKHTTAVAEFWNAKAQNQDSWWFEAPWKSADEINDLLSQGFSLVVALDHGVLMGFGLWYGPQLLGFTAVNQEAFYRMLRVWAEENPGKRGFSVIPARDTTEKRWMDELGVAELKPLGHKPLKVGEARAARKPWTLRADGPLDALRIAIDKQLAEMSR